MAAITWSDVENHAAALSVVPVGAQTDILGFVNGALDVTVIGGADGESSYRVKLARIYLAAHFGLLGVGGTGDAGGPIKSEKLGDESRGYGSFSMDYANLASTGFGAAYISMIQNSPARAPIVLGGY